jgi:biotin transport system substrate-specific component
MFIAKTLSTQTQLSHRARVASEIAIFCAGVLLVSALARVVIRLPWTPVPITGQTFGVALMALLWGRNRAIAVVAGYIGIGALGAPVFAGGDGGASALVIGPTIGYIGGMLLAAPLVGWLADRGATRSFFTAFGAAACGSVVIFTCGVFGLSFWLPHTHIGALLTAGLLPFLPGDFLKNIIAASIATRVTKTV